MTIKGKKVLDKITPYKPGKPIEEVKRELGLDKVIKLASNENAEGPSPKVIKAINDAAGNVNRYPDGGCFYLRKTLSEKLSVTPENIVLGNGSDEVIVLALRAFVNPGDEVIIADPTFLVYRIAASIEGANIRLVPLEDYKYDLNAMAAAISPETKMIFIANPDNPTGSYVNSNELDDFLRKVPDNVLVFIDEAYYEFASGGDYPETLELIERRDCNVVIARTFSKAYSLAGLRVGYGIARADIAEALNKVREPFNVNSIAQTAAIAALEDTEYLERVIKTTNGEKERFYKVFDSLGIRYVPSKTNFILVQTDRDAAKIFDYLLKCGVIVREMSAWGIKNCIRVNIGLPEENDIFFGIFEEALKVIPKEQ